MGEGYQEAVSMDKLDVLVLEFGITRPTCRSSLIDARSKSLLCTYL
jgi:hypothetical protein